MTIVTLWHGVTFAYESITVSSVAVALTSGTYKVTGALPVRRAIITVEDDSIRFRTDGTDPTSSEGHRGKEDDIIILDSRNDIVNFRAIRISTDAKIRISYKR
ncbi:hypothetical protein LCGC14_1880800 [marine sediment metagenome]|uniref:Uncharacterized protein n=1 Tax=marine sediment metagenome TaxID=412755 RepID=A0A0F9G2C6_9ZZZZ